MSRSTRPRAAVTETADSRKSDEARPGGAPDGRTGAETRPAVSVLVPVTERPEPLDDLYREYSEVLRSSGWSLEFLFVAPGWRRKALDPLRELRDDGAPIRILEVGGGDATEADLLRTALSRARSDLLLTLPAYRQIDPQAVPELLRSVGDGVDLALACRSPRRDPWINRFQNRLFHALLQLLVGGRFTDTGCGVRAMRREVLDKVPLYGDYDRFLPILASRKGFRVREVPARQHDRDAAESRVYAPGTYLRRLIDLLGLFFLTRFTYKPLRFFGLVGGALGGAGGVILLIVSLQKLAGQSLAERPLLVLGVLLATLGVQAVALGLVGEIIVHFNAPDQPDYRVFPDDGDES